MKKMKGVASVMGSSSLTYAAVCEDPRTRLKYQSLMQDFEDLYKETAANKDKLQTMRKKKLTLLAEVRFLRQRYRYLTQIRSLNPPAETNYVQPLKVVSGSKNARKEKNFSRNGVAVKHPVPRFDLNQNGKVQREGAATFLSPAPVFDVNKKQKAYNGKEAAMRNSLLIPDLNQKERINNGKEAAACNIAPIFDLNQISREEEELRANSEAMKIEELKISSMRVGIDEQHGDVKLSACRNLGNGSSRAGKRKISWQDQVALRV